MSAPVSRSYRRYVLGLLLVILAFNYVDRLVLSLVLQDIKVDLGLSDSELGLLTGLAFALFYSVMGIPIARWADRGNRATLISLATALWSAAVVLSGAAATFLQLLWTRVGAAVGEAGCIPPAHSLIADYFSRSERPRALAIYMLGLPLGMVLGYFVAGWLNELHGWRATFVLLGIPGILIAIVARCTLRDPREMQPRTAAAASPPAFISVCAVLIRNRTFCNLLLGLSVAYFFGYGLLQWQPAFFIRSYGLRSGQLGTWFAVVYGAGGLIGTWLGGELASRFAARNERLQLRVMAAMYVAFGALSAATYLVGSYPLAFALIGLATIGGNAGNGPLFATIQSLVPQNMRAVAIATIYLFANLIGMGLGPLAVGALSDAYSRWAGEESLRYALLTLSPGYLWAAWHLWRSALTVEGDLSRTAESCAQGP